MEVGPAIWHSKNPAPPSTHPNATRGNRVEIQPQLHGSYTLAETSTNTGASRKVDAYIINRLR
jgi:hypothetical protein